MSGFHPFQTFSRRSESDPLRTFVSGFIDRLCSTHFEA